MDSDEKIKFEASFFTLLQSLFLAQNFFLDAKCLQNMISIVPYDKQRD